MSEIYNLFEVYATKDIPDGFVVENCSDYDEALGEAVIYCREARKCDMRVWIEKNVQVNTQNVLHLLDTNPEICITYLKQVSGISTFTEFFVQDCGSIQSFLDIYCKSEVDNSDESLSAEAITTELEDDLPILDEPESSSEVEDHTFSDITKTLNSLADLSANEEASDQSNDIPDTIVVSDAVDDTTEQQLPENTEITTDEEIVEDTNVVESVEEDSSADNEDTLPSDPVTTPVSALSDDQMNTIVDGITSHLVSAINDGMGEVRMLRVQASQMLEDAEQKQKALEDNYGAISNFFTPSGTFVGFNDPDRYVEMLTALKDLDKRICLSSIDPESILDKVELTKAISYLGIFSPVVFKMFFLKLVNEATDERDRMRVSALLNDFAVFAKEGCNS